jgi:hypothetical protein
MEEKGICDLSSTRFLKDVFIFFRCELVVSLGLWIIVIDL